MGAINAYHLRRANTDGRIVIGYYEGWNAKSKCHETLPSDLPGTGITPILILNALMVVCLLDGCF